MYQALVRRDSTYEGIFFVAVRTTGIFCRPTCPARKPAARNVEYFLNTSQALFNGYRPCLRCRPMECAGEVPDWLRPLLKILEEEPFNRLRDADLRGMGINPRRVQRWFKTHHSMTFHAYQRARRLGQAMGRLSLGADIMNTALDSGFESLSGFQDALRRLVGESPSRCRGKTLVHVTRVQTPLGPMVIGATQEVLCLLEFADRRMLETQLKRVEKFFDAVLVPGDTDLTRRTARELEEYFHGTLQRFTVPFELRGTEFQNRVWSELCAIPYGETLSYAKLAERIGSPRAVRAVARANGDNRISILIPCHRVIGSDGNLTGYGGGLWRKKWLLQLEKHP